MEFKEENKGIRKNMKPQHVVYEKYEDYERRTILGLDKSRVIFFIKWIAPAIIIFSGYYTINLWIGKSPEIWGDTPRRHIITGIQLLIFGLVWLGFSVYLTFSKSIKRRWK